MAVLEAHSFGAYRRFGRLPVLSFYRVQFSNVCHYLEPGDEQCVGWHDGLLFGEQSLSEGKMLRIKY